MEGEAELGELVYAPGGVLDIEGLLADLGQAETEWVAGQVRGPSLR